MKCEEKAIYRTEQAAWESLHPHEILVSVYKCHCGNWHRATLSEKNSTKVELIQVIQNQQATLRYLKAEVKKLKKRK